MLDHLAAPAAGQDADQGRVGGHAVAAAKARAIAALPGFLGDRMADEAAGQPVALEERRLERQQRQQVVDVAGEARGALLAPRPDLGGDVVHAQRRQAAEAALQAQREARRIDRQHQRRPAPPDLADRLAQPLREARQVRHDLGEADQRQFLHREQADQAALGHARPADPEELEAVAGLLARAP